MAHAELLLTKYSISLTSRWIIMGAFQHEDRTDIKSSNQHHTVSVRQHISHTTFFW